jgi:hypothetical protein
MNHGPMAAPFVGGGLLAQKAVEAGGAERVPFAVIHRRLFRYGPVRSYFARNFNTSRPFGFEDIVANFGTGRFTDFMVLPEGSNELFGDMVHVRPFKSHRFIELSILLNAPVLVTVHRGTENWSTWLKLDDFTLQALGFLNPRFARRIVPSRTLNLPGIPMRVPKLYMKSELHYPDLKAHELSQEPSQRYHQLRAASEELRRRMNDMIEELPAPPSDYVKPDKR